jgi:predicted ATPase
VLAGASFALNQSLCGSLPVQLKWAMIAEPNETVPATMKIKSVSVKGYRTIRDEMIMPIDRLVTLVGPNNSGKTNTLQAIQCFFTGYENQHEYDFDLDICSGYKNLRTNIQIVLSEISISSDKEIFDTIEQIRTLLSLASGEEEEITLYLTFSPNSNPSYRVFPNIRRPQGSDAVTYSRTERRLFDLIFEKF